MVCSPTARRGRAAQAATEHHGRNICQWLTSLRRYAVGIVLVGVVQVTAGPGDQGAAGAAGRGYLRASDADREHVIDVLKVAFVQGRLTKGELDARVGQTFASQTYGQLALVTADIPAEVAATRPPRPPARARAQKPVTNSAKVAAWGGAGEIILLAVLVTAFFLTGNGAFFVLAFMSVILGSSVVGAFVVDAWQERSRRQLPPCSARGGQALEGEQNGEPGDDRILCQARRSSRARHLPGHYVTQRIWRSVPARRASAGLCT
jgi:DUF1707 SHOCT-like domain